MNYRMTVSPGFLCFSCTDWRPSLLSMTALFFLSSHSSAGNCQRGSMNTSALHALQRLTWTAAGLRAIKTHNYRGASAALLVGENKEGGWGADWWRVRPFGVHLHYPGCGEPFIRWWGNERFYTVSLEFLRRHISWHNWLLIHHYIINDFLKFCADDHRFYMMHQTTAVFFFYLSHHHEVDIYGFM